MKWNSKLIYHCEHCDQSFKLGTRGKLLSLAFWMICFQLTDLLCYILANAFKFSTTGILIVLLVLLLLVIFAESRFQITYLILNGRELDRINDNQAN